MKSRKILVLAIAICSSTLSFAGNGMGNMGMGNMGMGMGGPFVPINNGLIFLLIAGLLFGIKKAYGLSKQKNGS